jgi:hypothetical protein
MAKAADLDPDATVTERPALRAEVSCRYNNILSAWLEVGQMQVSQCAGGSLILSSFSLLTVKKIVKKNICHRFVSNFNFCGCGPHCSSLALKLFTQRANWPSSKKVNFYPCNMIAQEATTCSAIRENQATDVCMSRKQGSTFTFIFVRPVWQVIAILPAWKCFFK